MPTWFERKFSKKSDEIEKSSVIDDLEKEARSYELNPYDVANMSMMNDAGIRGNYYHETGARTTVTYDHLENLTKHPIVSSILQTRINQIAEFARFSDDDDLGFSIRLKDKEAEPTDEDKQKMMDLRKFIENCGSETTDFELNFESFLKQIVRDSLSYDQCNFEVVRNRLGEVVSFHPVDAKTIRRAKISKEEVEAGRRNYEKIAYVQVMNGKAVAEYNQKELCFGVRRPRTDLRSQKYGYPELEELIGVIQNIYQAETYNASNFTNGINANGIIAVKSKMNPNLFRAFRREFYQMLNGVHNARRTPLIQLDPEGDEAIQSINLNTSNREMEYDNWLKYLIKLSCSVFQMDPAEIGFVFGQEGQGNSFVSADPNARILMGKEKGLRPLIRSIEGWLNKYIVSQIDDRFEITFNYLDSISLLDKVKLEEHRMKYLTLNEIRASHDLEEIEDGDIIAAYYGQLKATAVRAGIADLTEDDKDVEKSVDTDKDGKKHPKQYFEGLDEKTKRRREKEIERRKEQGIKPPKLYEDLPGDEDAEVKPSKHSKTDEAEAVRDEMKDSSKEEFIRACAKVSGVSKKIIEEVYDKGMKAWSTSGHRPGASPQAWARARVYAFLFDAKSGARRADQHLWQEHLDAKKSFSPIDLLDAEMEDIYFIKQAKKDYENDYEDIDLVVKGKTWKAPKDVADEARRGLEAIEEHGSDAGTAVGRRRATQLANGEEISYETIKRMKAFFDRHEKNKEIAEGKEWHEDNGYVSWLLWGGDAGRKFAEKVISEEEASDE